MLKSMASGKVLTEVVDLASQLRSGSEMSSVPRCTDDDYNDAD